MLKLLLKQLVKRKKNQVKLAIEHNRIDRLNLLSSAFDGAVLNSSGFRRATVFSEKALIYNRVHKNANTTIMKIFDASLSGEINRRDEWLDYPTLGTYPIGEIDKLKSCNTLVVIRNPYSRVLSAFLDKFRHERIVSRFGSFAFDPPGFKSFLISLTENGDRWNHHWSPQSDHIFMPLKHFSHIIKFENLDIELLPTIRSLGFELSHVDTAIKGGTFHKTNASDLLNRYYDKESRFLVRKIFARDFEFLGYDPDQL